MYYRYLESVKPLLTDNEFKETEQARKKFTSKIAKFLLNRLWRTSEGTMQPVYTFICGSGQ